MRKIVFRGKTLDGGAWIRGHFVEIEGLPCIFINGMAVRVVPETVGQFTGLHDRNGIEIFEGDIVDCSCYTVSYCADVNESLGMNAGWCIQRHNYEGWYYLENHEGHIVLGNPWDNPELMQR